MENIYNRIFNCDCMDLLHKIKDNTIDAVLSSPPYNIIRPNSTDRGYDVYKDGMTNDEYCKWTCDIFNQFERILKKNSIVLWNMSYGSENTECMSLTVADIIRNTDFTLADIIVWKKKSATPNNVSHNKMTRICEFVYVFCRKTELLTFNANKQKIGERNDTSQAIYENIYNFVVAKNNDGSCELNKATYSTDLCCYLLNLYCKRDSLILDPFMGTATTAVAALSCNMYYIGSELSEAQCEYAKNRLSQPLQIKLF